MTTSDLPPQNLAKAWLTLFRPPNLFTVPGDPLVGALLAALALNSHPVWNSVYAVMGSALAFYASGLLANDFFDRAIDARERPTRPIPSGAVSAAAVKWVALLLSLAGLLMTLPAGPVACGTGLLVTLAAWFYNSIGKKIAWLAPLSMGLCRGLSLLLGAAVLGLPGIGSPLVLLAALVMTLFIALITLAARHEASENAPPIPLWNRWGIPVFLAGGLLCLLFNPWTAMGFKWQSLSTLLAAMAILWTLFWSTRLKFHTHPRLMQASIGNLIRGLLFTQAALCAACGASGENFALLILLLFPVSGWIGKWFYGS